MKSFSKTLLFTLLFGILACAGNAENKSLEFEYTLNYRSFHQEMLNSEWVVAGSTEIIRMDETKLVATIDVADLSSKFDDQEIQNRFTNMPSFKFSSKIVFTRSNRLLEITSISSSDKKTPIRWQTSIIFMFLKMSNMLDTVEIHKTNPNERENHLVKIPSNPDVIKVNGEEEETSPYRRDNEMVFALSPDYDFNKHIIGNKSLVSLKFDGINVEYYLRDLDSATGIAKKAVNYKLAFEESVDKIKLSDLAKLKDSPNMESYTIYELVLVEKTGGVTTSR